MAYPVKLPQDDPLLTITHPSSYSWIIELHNGQDSRLTERLLREGLTPALNIVERDWRLGTTKARKAKDSNAGHGSLVIVGNRSQNKFFSNGLVYEDIKDNKMFVLAFFNPIFVRLLSYPIPTVCAMNGHSFAGGFLIAMACDYRVMTAGKAWACMNEIHFGAPIPRSVAGLLRAKSPSPAILRKILLEGHRFVPQELLALGLVDELVEGDTEKVLGKAVELGTRWAPHAKSGVWGLHKREIYKEAIDLAQEHHATVFPDEEGELFMDTIRAHL